jgi:hypothetical protein
MSEQSCTPIAPLRVPIAPMREAIRHMRLRAEPSNRLTLARLRILERNNPGEIFIEEVGVSAQGRPIHRVIVARDAKDRTLDQGGHVSLHNQHAPENTAASIVALASFLQPLMKARHPVFGSGQFVYRAYVSTDVDGHELNSHHGKRFNARRFLETRERPFRLNKCTDYEMPLELDQYGFTPRAESRSVSELIDLRRPDSISSHHRVAWGASSAFLNQIDDPGFAHSLSAVLQAHGPTAAFDVDFPQSRQLAPGVFQPPTLPQLEKVGLQSIPSYLHELRHAARYVLIDTCAVRVGSYDTTPQRNIDAFDNGTRRVEATRAPFIERLSALPLDPQDRRDESVQGWLQFLATDEQPTMHDFVPPDRDPDALAWPTDAFALSDYRVWVELGRMAQAANAADRHGCHQLAAQMWEVIDTELEQLERTRGFVEVPPEIGVSAGAEAELLTLAGGIAWGFVDFGEPVNETYRSFADAVREAALSR